MASGRSGSQPGGWASGAGGPLQQRKGHMKRRRFRCGMTYYFTITCVRVQLKKIEFTQFREKTGLPKGPCEVPRRTGKLAASRGVLDARTAPDTRKDTSFPCLPGKARVAGSAVPTRLTSGAGAERKSFQRGRGDHGPVGAVSQFQSFCTGCWERLWDTLACAHAQQARGWRGRGDKSEVQGQHASERSGGS